MVTVIVPGFFSNAFFGQNSPALWATGTISDWSRAESHAPPIWYFPRCPGAILVPSGKTMIYQPFLSLFLPWVSICFNALGPLDRSIAMGFIIANPQPKNGTNNRLFLRTQTWGGKIVWNANVSQADWCFERITQGLSGIFSKPWTRYRMPQMYLARKVIQCDHKVMIWYLRIEERGNVRMATIEKITVRANLNNSNINYRAKLSTITQKWYVLQRRLDRQTVSYL